MDTSNIPGYAEMSPEEKISALEGFEVDYSGYVKKEQYDKVASESAERKRKLNEYLSEEEKNKASREEELETLRNQLAEVTRTNTLTKHNSSLLALGFESKLAEETAKAIADGDADKLFTNIGKYKEMLEKNIKAELLKNVPKPETGTANNTMTLEKLRKMSPADRYNYSQEHPDEYKSLYQME